MLHVVFSFLKSLPQATVTKMGHSQVERVFSVKRFLDLRLVTLIYSCTSMPEPAEKPLKMSLPVLDQEDKMKICDGYLSEEVCWCRVDGGIGEVDTPFERTSVV